MTSKKPTLVSVVIPCYNQARYLGEAIESVLAQTYQHFEIVVIDDGSTDSSAEVAARYANVRSIRQPNQGRCAARNAGLGESRGDYIVFLDADDRLLPHALKTGVERLVAHPECALTYGFYYHITSNGSPLPMHQPYEVDKDHYLELLRTNIINMVAAVMFRREVFEIVGGFDVSLTGAEDYDLYFRIARRFPIHRHSEVIAEYRQHGANTTSATNIMRRDTFAVMRRQWKHVNGNKRYEQAYKEGMRRWQTHWGDQYVNELRRHVRTRNGWRQVGRGLLTMLQYYPRGIVVHACRKLYCVVFGVKSDLA